MQLFGIIALSAGVAVVARTLTERDGPSAQEVHIGDFTYSGSGCQPSTAAIRLSDDLTTLMLSYSDFVVQAGEGIAPGERRKYCDVRVQLYFPQGWQFSVVKADYIGYALLPDGATGTCNATYYFPGSLQQTASSVDFQGPFNGDYLQTDVFDSTVWSPCGIEGMLNVNSVNQISLRDPNQIAVLGPESTSSTFKQVTYLQWRNCSE